MNRSLPVVLHVSFSASKYSLFLYGYRTALALALGVITTLALVDNPELPISLWDKANHVLAFFTLSFLANRSFPQPDQRIPKAQWLALLAYGVLLEILQAFTPHREPSLLDVVADAIGLVAYSVVYRVATPSTTPDNTGSSTPP